MYVRTYVRTVELAYDIPDCTYSWIVSTPHSVPLYVYICMYVHMYIPRVLFLSPLRCKLSKFPDAYVQYICQSSPTCVQQAPDVPTAFLVCMSPVYSSHQTFQLHFLFACHLCIAATMYCSVSAVCCICPILLVHSSHQELWLHLTMIHFTVCYLSAAICLLCSYIRTYTCSCQFMYMHVYVCMYV